MDERKHPRARDGKFTNADANRDDPGQVGQLLLKFPEDLKAGDVLVNDGERVTLRSAPVVQTLGPTSRVRYDTDQGEMFSAYSPQYVEDDGTECVDEDAEVGHTIRSQIEGGVLMSLGASNVRARSNGLSFDARISDRTMQVDVDLNGMDYYDITVTDGERIYAEAGDVDVSSLNRTLLALDYDGDEPFNPRYM